MSVKTGVILGKGKDIRRRKKIAETSVWFPGLTWEETNLLTVPRGAAPGLDSSPTGSSSGPKQHDRYTWRNRVRLCDARCYCSVLI